MAENDSPASKEKSHLLYIKKVLKHWENDFVALHGKKPKKDDIAEAPPFIKESYEEYTRLKTETSANIWGRHLDKSNELKRPSEDIKSVSSNKETAASMTKLGNKLLENALSTPGKHSGFGSPRAVTKARTTKQKENARHGVPGCDASAATRERPKSGAGVASVPDSCEDDVLVNTKFKNSLFEAALKSTTKKTDTFKSPLPERRRNREVSDVSTPLSFMGLNKTPKLTYGLHFGETGAGASHVTEEDVLEQIKDTEDTELSRSFTENASDCFALAASARDSQPLRVAEEEKAGVEMGGNQSLTSRHRHVSSLFLDRSISTSQRVDVNNPSEKCTDQSISALSKERTTEKNFPVIDLTSHASFSGDAQASNAKKRKRQLSAEVSTSSMKKMPTRPLDEDSVEYQGDVGWQHQGPDLTVDLDEAKDEQSEREDTQPEKKRKTYKGSSGAGMNDNFVRLNMKAKRFSRGGRGMSGGAHKRMAWKQKMKARSESFGNTKCFKCGQEGHWANKCKGNRGGARAGNIEVDHDAPNVTEADFPSMKDAANMARGIPLKKPASAASDKTAKDEKRAEVLGNPAEAEGDSEAVRTEADLELEMNIVRAAYEPKEAPAAIDPLYTAPDEEDLLEPPPEVYEALNKFGFKSFRYGQQKAIMRILQGKSTLVILSTGAGKSLCYQLPAYMYAQKNKSICLIISPLVSLMDDQVTGLPAGIYGACLHNNMTKSQREKVQQSVSEGKVHFLLVSPEAIASSAGGYGSLFGKGAIPSISFACIDEAHCVSEWSHHFRPSYLRICKILREQYGVRCMLGLTATATMVTAASVAQHLGIEDYKSATIRDIPVPRNLQLSVSRDEDKDDSLLTILQGDRFSKLDSIIIYCTRRQQTDSVATLIRTCLKEPPPAAADAAEDLPPFEETQEAEKTKGKGMKKAKAPPKKARKVVVAECYHAGMSAPQRRRVQNAFMAGHLRIVVATVAFGMGLDKADVRGIIHYSSPKSFESYVQEIGRAGRDGLPAHCHLLLDAGGQDVNELKRHIYSNTIDRIIIKKLMQKVFTPCRCRALHERQQQLKGEDEESGEKAGGGRICPGHERALPIEATVQSLDMKEEGISTLLCYLELHPDQWVMNLQPVYAMCSLQCYGGPPQLQAIAKKCPPVAVAIAKEKQKGSSFSTTNKVDFNVVHVADAMGWDSGPVKRELKLLQWNLSTADGHGPRKSGVMVEFSDLAFHLRSPGDLTDEELDGVVDFLNDRVETQERTELTQLKRLQDTLKGVSHKAVWMCMDHIDTDRSERLKAKLREYFEQQPQVVGGQVTILSFAREWGDSDRPSILEEVHCEHEDVIRRDIVQFVHLYGSEHSLSGRAIARVFHGIPSPCFPADVWGRVRRFWRCHLPVDFNVLRRMATQEIIGMRR